MPQGLKPALDRIARGGHLSETQAQAAFDCVMSGEATPAQIAALLMGLRVRGESIAELTGAARAMRGHMLTVRAPSSAPICAIDICGTGGDGHGTLNVSTAAAFVLAAMGVPVAKHGNRAQSSRTGATDVLAALGLPAIGDPDVLARQLARHHLAFFAAPLHHPALRHAAGVRLELGTRTVFNLLGPLCNPASVSHQLLGVFDPLWLEPMALTLQGLGSNRVWVVHGEGSADGGLRGIDELSLAGCNRIVALEDNRLHRFTLTPEAVGLDAAPIDAIAGGDAQHNAQALEAMLRGARGPYRDTVLLNAAAALRVARGGNIFPPEPLPPQLGAAAAETSAPLALLREAIALAARAIDNGSAWNVLQALRADASGNGERHG